MKRTATTTTITEIRYELSVEEHEEIIKDYVWKNSGVVAPNEGGTSHNIAFHRDGSVSITCTYRKEEEEEDDGA